MGQYMISAEQMFPNKKRLDADEKYMTGMSSVEEKEKKATLNELIAAAKKNYYEWIIIKKKLSILDQNEKLLEFHDYKCRNKIQEWFGKNKCLL